MNVPHEVLGLIHNQAEVSVLAAMQRDTEQAVALVQQLEPNDFYDTRRAVVFEAIRNLLRGIEPVDANAIVSECWRVARVRDLSVRIDHEYLDTLAGEIDQAHIYATTIKRLAWLRRAGEFAFWLTGELQMRPSPDDLFAEAQERWQQLRPTTTDSRFTYGWDTLKQHADIQRTRARELEQGVINRFDWPWVSWNHNRLVGPLRPGFVGILAAPDGIGKTTYLEMIAEHWAATGKQVVYVHLEDDLEYKLDRRLARHARVSFNAIEDHDLSADEQDSIREAYRYMSDWTPNLHYYHAPGESMDVIVRELESRIAEGVCEAVVFDYLDKVQPTRTQAQLYSNNIWERQAADMETLKSFAERNYVPVMTATQGNKAMQQRGTQTRANIQGTGQKSQKAQLVIILTREIVGENGLCDRAGNEIAGPGQYSPIVNVRIDKQNRGRTGNLQQFMRGEYFKIGDIDKLRHE